MLSSFAKFFFRLFGWTVEGELPDIDKYIIVGAPHTSNWDFAIMLFVSAIYRKQFRWMGKDTLFRWPFGRLFKFLGGIPINRQSKNNAVTQAIQSFKERKSLIMLITPEGTRKKVEYWKSGFYHIAKGAHVPLLLGFVDYKRKVGGVGSLLYLSNDIESDLQVIRNFYSTVSAKYPDKTGEIRLRVKGKEGS